MTETPPKPVRVIAPFEIRVASETEAESVEALYHDVFGPGRFAKTAERLREGNRRIEPACFVATDAEGMVGSVQFWPLLVDGAPGGVLLGPLGIATRRRGDGIAFRLMEAGIGVCAERGDLAVILVGDEPYYARAGFSRADIGRFRMPGPVDESRILVRELKAEASSLRGALSVPRATKPAS